MVHQQRTSQVRYMKRIVNPAQLLRKFELVSNGSNLFQYLESFSPSGDFEKITLLVPGLCLLSFEGLGFDLLLFSAPALHEMTLGTLSSRLVPQHHSSIPFISPTRNDWDILLQSLLDEYFFPPPCVDHPIPKIAAPVPDVLTGSPSLTLVNQDASSPRLQISQSPRGIFLNQSKYALEIIKKYGMETSDPVDTPMVKKSKLDADL
nr:uncharacterized mitochondrial protein AtMg00810-like [Tanacetum cinerariifolium]